MEQRRAEADDAAGDRAAVEPTKAGDERRIQRHFDLASFDVERAEDALVERNSNQGSADAEQVAQRRPRRNIRRRGKR